MQVLKDFCLFLIRFQFQSVSEELLIETSQKEWAPWSKLPPRNFYRWKNGHKRPKTNLFQYLGHSFSPKKNLCYKERKSLSNRERSF